MIMMTRRLASASKSFKGFRCCQAITPACQRPGRAFLSA